MKPHIGSVLGGFRHRVDRRLTGRQYTPLEDAMAEAVLQEVHTYVSRLQNTVAYVIATRPIMDLCMASERRPGTRISKRW